MSLRAHNTSRESESCSIQSITLLSLATGKEKCVRKKIITRWMEKKKNKSKNPHECLIGAPSSLLFKRFKLDFFSSSVVSHKLRQSSFKSNWIHEILHFKGGKSILTTISHRKMSTEMMGTSQNLNWWAAMKFYSGVFLIFGFYLLLSDVTCVELHESQQQQHNIFPRNHRVENLHHQLIELILSRSSSSWPKIFYLLTKLIDFSFLCNSRQF